MSAGTIYQVEPRKGGWAVVRIKLDTGRRTVVVAYRDSATADHVVSVLREAKPREQ